MMSLNKYYLMENTNLLKLLVLIFIFATFGCNSELRFERIESQSFEFKNNFEDSLMTCSERYIVHGYRNDSITEKKIDSFVCLHSIPIYKKYSYYGIIFYKKSRKTNVNYIKKHPNRWSEYADYNDYLWDYDFSNTGFNVKEKLKNHEGRVFFYPKPKCLMKYKNTVY